MKIRDRYTGKEVPGDWLPADDMEVDVACPECFGSVERRIEELEKQLRDAGDAMAIQDERIEELRGALKELVDWHNGPPLRTWASDAAPRNGASDAAPRNGASDWRAAMKRAYRLLGRPVDKLPGDE